MKKFWMILVMALAVLQVEAQVKARQHIYGQNGVCVGIKGGVNDPKMLYWQNVALSREKQRFWVKPVAGLFADIPMGQNLTLAPEVMYVHRGTQMSYQHKPSGASVDYRMDVTCADMRVPVEFRFPLKSRFTPFLTVGAEMGMRIGGSIVMKRTAPIALYDSIPVGKANMGLLHAGVFGGAGVRYLGEIGRRDLLLKLSVTYHQGLLDTYSEMEKQGTATTSNVNAYHIKGQRLPSGLELTLGVAVSLKRNDDACASFEGDRSRRKGSRSHSSSF